MRARILLKSRAASTAKADGLLGRTRSGRPIPADGDVKRYYDADHHDAAARHVAAEKYHRGRATLHGDARDGDDDWKRSEGHSDEHERHDELAEHHGELARLHLTAGGRAASARLEVKDGKVALSDQKQATPEERARAKKELAMAPAMPGELSPRDREAYGRIARGEDA